MSNLNVEELVETLSGLSVLDMSKLKAALEEKWGVKAAAAPMMAMVPGVAPAGEAGGVEEKSEYNVELTATGDNKIGVISTNSNITDLLTGSLNFRYKDGDIGKDYTGPLNRAIMHMTKNPSGKRNIRVC